MLPMQQMRWQTFKAGSVKPGLANLYPLWLICPNSSCRTKSWKWAYGRPSLGRAPPEAFNSTFNSRTNASVST